MIYAAARGPKQIWVVPNAFHTAALGFQPEEFKRRVFEFFATHSKVPANSPAPTPPPTAPSPSSAPGIVPPAAKR